MDLAAGRHKDAIARVENAIQRQPASAAFRLLAAETYLRAGDAVKAESALHAALERDPTQFNAYSLLAQIYASQKRLPEAIKQFEGLRVRNPKSVVATAALGMLLHLSGRTADAEKMYEDAIALEPRAVIASNNLAWLLAEDNRNLDRALELAQAARRQLPENPDIADTLGWVLVKKQLGEQAIPLLEFSAKARPKDPVTQYHLGMAYKLLGNKADARRALGRALELNQAFAGSDDARRALSAL
jgi:predicted Zn-dependent protease